MFSPPNDHVHILDPVASPGDGSSEPWAPLSFGTRTNDYYRNWNRSGVQFRPDDHHQSGVSSPPLWQNYRALSPASRAEAIARGQWELMEMVKNMPESCYELSLKDLVEQPTVVPESQEECLIKDAQPAIVPEFQQQRQESGKKNEKKKNGKMARNGSMDMETSRGMFLKILFPVSLEGLNKKKNSQSVGKTLAKVSPKPEGSERSTKSVDKDWWKKRSWGSRESDSSNTSSSINSSSTSSRSNSNASTNRRRRGFLTSCWCSFNFRKRKSAE